MNIEPARRSSLDTGKPAATFLLQEANLSAQMLDDYKTPDPAKILEGAKPAYSAPTSDLAAAASVRRMPMVQPLSRLPVVSPAVSSPT